MKLRFMVMALVALVVLAGCGSATDAKDPATSNKISAAPQATVDKYDAAGNAATVATNQMTSILTAIQGGTGGTFDSTTRTYTITYPKDAKGIALAGTLQQTGVSPNLTTVMDLTFTLTDVSVTYGTSTAKISGTFTMKGTSVVSSGSSSGTSTMTVDMTGVDASSKTFTVKIAVTSNSATGVATGTVVVDGVTYSIS
jgi:uncharacterized protein YceK